MDGRLSNIESIYKRIGHIVVSYRHFIIVWGGFVGDFTKLNLDALSKTKNSRVNPSRAKSESSRISRSTYCPANQIWFYNCISGLWTSKCSSGQIPLKTSASTALVVEDFLYIFGGMEEFLTPTNRDQRYRSDLYRLNLATLSWERLSPAGPRPSPCDKGCGWAYLDKLYFFGGYGPMPDPALLDFNFQADIHNSNPRLGWNNNFFGYDIQNNTWFKPRTKGRTPDPRAAHAATIADNYGFLFGGRLGECRSNDMYRINFDTMVWSSNLNESNRNTGPVGRSWLTFNFVSPNRAVLYGGLRQYGSPAMDYWECEFSSDFERIEWKKCVQPIEPRVWHQAAFCDVTGELVVIGGVSKSPYDMDEEHLVDKPTILKYKPASLYRSALYDHNNPETPHDMPMTNSSNSLSPNTMPGAPKVAIVPPSRFQTSPDALETPPPLKQTSSNPCVTVHAVPFLTGSASTDESISLSASPVHLAPLSTSPGERAMPTRPAPSPPSPKPRSSSNDSNNVPTSTDRSSTGCQFVPQHASVTKTPDNGFEIIEIPSAPRKAEFSPTYPLNMSNYPVSGTPNSIDTYPGFERTATLEACGSQNVCQCSPIMNRCKTPEYPKLHSEPTYKFSINPPVKSNSQGSPYVTNSPGFIAAVGSAASSISKVASGVSEVASYVIRQKSSPNPKGAGDISPSIDKIVTELPIMAQAMSDVMSSPAMDYVTPAPVKVGFAVAKSLIGFFSPQKSLNPQ